MAASASLAASDIAVLWPSALLRARQKRLSFAEGCTREYQDQLMRGGDTVRINTVGDITINSSHSRVADMTLQNLRTTDQSLVIDAEDDYAFYWDIVNDVQTVSAVMDQAAERASYKLRDVFDQYISSKMQAGSGQTLSSRVIGTGGADSDAYELIVDFETALDDVDAPEEGRFLYVPPWYKGMLQKDPRKSSFGTSANLATYGSGYIGRTVSGLELFVSRNLQTSGDGYYLQGGHRGATALAEQINQSKVVENPVRMGKNILGIHVYGAKVIRNDELVTCLVTRSTDF